MLRNKDIDHVNRKPISGHTIFHLFLLTWFIFSLFFIPNAAESYRQQNATIHQLESRIDQLEKLENTAILGNTNVQLLKQNHRYERILNNHDIPFDLDMIEEVE